MITKTVLKTKILLDASRRSIVLPVIYIADFGPLLSHIKYLIKKSKSHSWNQRSAQAVSLLLDYSEANLNTFKTPKELFNEFSNALRTGTLDNDGYDPAGLNWKVRSENSATELTRAVTFFCNHLNDITEDDESMIKRGPISNWELYSDPNIILSHAAYQHRKNNAFLSHIFGPNQRSMDAFYKQRFNTGPSTKTQSAKSFDETQIQQLIIQGFKNEKNAIYGFNLKNVLITLLMHYGGLRVSEPFHLYINDIMEDPVRKGVALVKVYHPIEGTPPVEVVGKYKNRQEYLRNEYQLEDRVTSTNRAYHAGWKGMLYDNYEDKCSIVQWFPIKMGEVFWDLWIAYLSGEYKCPNPRRAHPFAFTNQFGDPASINQYLKAHRKGVEKIGLVESKSFGTHPHGHRHSFGRRLKKAGLSSAIIKKAMHHKSIDSQQTYVVPTMEEIHDELKKASANIATDSKKSEPARDNQPYAFKDVDPTGLFNKMVS